MTKKRANSYLFLVVSIAIILIVPSLISRSYSTLDSIAFFPRFYWHFVLSPFFALIISIYFFRTKKIKWLPIILLVILAISYELNFYLHHYLIDLQWAKHSDLPPSFNKKILSYTGYGDYLEHEIDYFNHLKFRVEMMLPWIITFGLYALLRGKFKREVNDGPLDKA